MSKKIKKTQSVLLMDQWWALREDKTEKIKYHLIPTSMLKRLAIHYTNGGKLHWDRNWEWWDMKYAELAKESARRHFIQRQNGEQDEDHMAACTWNLFAYEYLKEKNKSK